MVSGRFVNVYSGNDWMLGLLYRWVGGRWRTAGQEGGGVAAVQGCEEYSSSPLPAQPLSGTAVRKSPDM